MICEDGSLLTCLIFGAEATIEDGEDVMGGQVVGVDRLDDLVFGARLLVLVFLVKGETQLAVGISRTRERASHEVKIGNGAVEITLVAFE